MAQGDRKRQGTEEQGLDASYLPGPSWWTLNLTVLEEKFSNGYQRSGGLIRTRTSEISGVAQHPRVPSACDIDRLEYSSGRV